MSVASDDPLTAASPGGAEAVSATRLSLGAPFDASSEHNRKQVVLAGELGYDSTLVAQRTISPASDEPAHLEAWTAPAANAGTAAGLVGTSDEVARRSADFRSPGAETFMLQFQPFESEMARFVEYVAPRARVLAASGVAR